MLLVYDYELKTFYWRENAASGSDYYLRFTSSDLVPLLLSFLIREPAVKNGDLTVKTSRYPSYGLRSKRYLRYKVQDTVTLVKIAFRTLKKDLCLT